MHLLKPHFNFQTGSEYLDNNINIITVYVIYDTMKNYPHRGLKQHS